MPIGTPFPSPDHRAVAADVVRYVGEPVAVVVARDRYVARDAADAINVEYDPLPPVVDPEQALTGKPAVLHADFPNNAAVGPLPSGTGASPKGVDDTAIDQAFAEAEVVVSQRMVNHRLAPTSIEPRGVVAHYEPGKDAMTIWSSTQNPHILRTFIAQLTGLGQDQVRAIAPEVGGGFGSKINIYGEEYVAAALSRSGSACPSSGWRTARRRSSRPSTGATSSPGSTSRRAATAPCLASRCAWWPTSAPTTCCSRRPSPR